MSIYESEEELFSRWQGNRKGFVRDGVVCEHEYVTSNPKIAIILREVNDPNGGGWDLREFVSKGARAYTWNNVARWVHGINNRTTTPDWDFYARITPAFRVEALKGICAINLKKTPGAHATNHSELNAVARQDKEYISKQFALYDPDLTICGGTGALFKMIADHDSIQWMTTKSGIQWYERAPNRYVVSYCHPAARYSSLRLLVDLLAAVSEIYA